MSSWLSLKGRGTRKEGEGEEESKASSGAPAATPPAIDPEEMRRRRLERLQAMQAAQAAAQEEQAAAGEQEAKPSPPAQAPAPSPPKPAAPAPAPAPAPSPKAPEARPSSGSLSLSASSSGQVAPGRTAGIKALELAAHRLVQRVLQVTADPTEASSSSGLVLVDYGGNSQAQEGQGPVLFNVDAVSELVCARLLSGAGSSLPYQQGVLYLGVWSL